MVNSPIKPPMPPGGAYSQSHNLGGGEKKKFDLVDLKQYFHVVIRRIWLVALCFVISLAVTVVMLIQQEPTYSSRARLLISKGLPLPKKLMQEEDRPLGDYVITQINIIRSGMMRQRALERMGKPPSEVAPLILGVSVIQEWRTSIVNISVNSRDPLVAAEYANALAEEYLDFKAEQRMDTSQATVLSLTQQANRLREELQKADERLLAFERENKVIAIRERGNVAAEILSALNSQAAHYRMKRMLLEAEQPMLRNADNETVLSALRPLQPVYSWGRSGLGMIDSQTTTNMTSDSFAQRGGAFTKEMFAQTGWQDLGREKARLKAELEDLKKRFKNAHPLVQKTERKLDQIERDLNVELQFALQDYYAQLEALEIKESAAKRVESLWEGEAIESARKAHEYDSIKKQVNRLQGLYDLVFSRLKEVDLSLGIEPESITIMERAKPNYHAQSPGKIKNLLMSGLIGLGIGLGIVFGLEYIDDSMRYPEEVTRGLGIPFFGIIPAAKWDPDDLSTHILSNLDQKSGLSEAYRNVRSSLMFSGTEELTKVLAVTSSVPKEGKTTTSLNMSVSLSQAGSRVLLVDADMRRGETHKYFGLEAGRGLADILVGRAKPEAVIQRTEISNLDIIATGPFPPNPAELILQPEMSAFLEYAKRSYDRIILDCPPVMSVSETAILCSLADGVVFVVWAGQTSKKLAKMSIDRINERGAHILGCVLNNLEFGRVGYYYYSTYYGYYDYAYESDKGTGAVDSQTEG